MKHPEIVRQMTLEEKAAFCDGKDFWHLKSLERLELPEIMVTDGPHGLRKQLDKKEGMELLTSAPATCFPTAVTTASSWDPDMIFEMGEAMAQEALQEGVSVILGPGTNIKRSPLCGRNFEYFSEDPYLAGKMSAGFIKGVQSKQIGTSLKHFAGNNQEKRRMTVNTVADERTLREIYLTAFEIAVKESQPWTIMSSYNRLNGTYASENKWLLTDVLRDEWGFEGLVVTDWGAENLRAEGIKAGNDLEMPTSFGIGAQAIIDAVNNGDLSEEQLDVCVDRVVDLILKGAAARQNYTYDKQAHNALARRIAANSAVLLKNDDGLLPLDPGRSVAVIGEMARAPRYQGAGSSGINPNMLDNAFDKLLEAGVHALYSPGYSKKDNTPNAALIAEAVATAKKAQTAVVFIGLTEEYEAEGYDREHMRLPDAHNALVSAVAAANPNTVVVLQGGSPVEMPWLGKVKAVLNTYLGGQASGAATADVLTGAVTPSGKLAETYPVAYADNPSVNYFPGTKVSVEYREGIYVGYRYYDTAKKDVLFPFGYGLSYTTFAYSGLKLSKKKIADTDTLTVSFKVKNTGTTDGAEIAQVYVKDNESTIYRPEKELKGFVKVFLKAGEEKTVSVELSKRAFAFYNVDLHDWQVESGDFTILVGASSRDIRLEGKVQVTSTCDAAIPDYRETAPEYYTADVSAVSDASFAAVLGYEIPPCARDPYAPLTITNTLEDAEDSARGAAINKLINTLLKAMSGGDEANARMMKAMALQIPIRNFVSMSMGVFSPAMADALVDMLNGGKMAADIGKIAAGLAKSAKNIKMLINSI
ncbi:MAG: glycoside hydrolase family 3 C-terminal domain-containing protein [Clostridia bacterium]|nr:glycoside hydrolase family 3 C-terminal domain-containing protein [Clostridia bacterium]